MPVGAAFNPGMPPWIVIGRQRSTTRLVPIAPRNGWKPPFPAQPAPAQGPLSGQGLIGALDYGMPLLLWRRQLLSSLHREKEVHATKWSKRNVASTSTCAGDAHSSQSAPPTSAIPAADKALGGRGLLPVGTANAFNPLALAPLPGVSSHTSAGFAACDGYIKCFPGDAGLLG
jgi:hypothetical protein